jgi:hypothetical protein
VLGQHPELYGLPETNLFVADTIGERAEVLEEPRFAEDGLLRAVAQFLSGEQTVQSVGLAQSWLAVRAHSSIVSVFWELGRRVSPRRLVDKSPATALQPDYLERVQHFFPHAKYLHLLRHPASQCESLVKWAGPQAGLRFQAYASRPGPAMVDVQQVWYRMHTNIVRFLETVPAGDQLAVRGEDLLADLESHLTKIASWLGIRSDNAAMEAMKHPERSAFACLGPPNAPFGSDPDFLREPELRAPPGQSERSLDEWLPWRPDRAGFHPRVRALAQEFGYT